MSTNITELKEQVAKYKRYSEGGREVYFYPHYLILHQLTNTNHPWYVPVGVVGLLRDHRAKWYVLAEDKDVFQKELDRFLDNPKRLGDLEQFIKDLRDGAVGLLESRDLSTLSSDQLGVLTKKYYEWYEQIFAMTTTLRVADRAIVWRFQELLKDSDNVDGAIAALSAGEKLSFAAREERVLLDLALKMRSEGLTMSSEATQAELADIKNRFCWVSCGYYNEPAKTRADYKEALTELLDRDPQHLQEEFNTRLKKDHAAREKVLSQLDESGKQLAHVAAESVYLKDYGKFSANEIVYHSNVLFEEIAKRTQWDVGFIKNLLPQEVEQLLSGQEIDEDMVQDRVEHSVIVLLPGDEEIHVVLGDNATDLEDEYFVAEESEQTEWRGRAASPGYGRGHVKVVLGRRDFSKFEKGDILVATNTSPDFVPIMKKAAAIVAENGGITAHASVASREMGIPAVVGVANATQILKDGDEVEVDADQGIVKKLE